jgi:hypothetical protein
LLPLPANWTYKKKRFTVVTSMGVSPIPGVEFGDWYLRKSLTHCFTAHGCRGIENRRNRKTLKRVHPAGFQAFLRVAIAHPEEYKHNLLLYDQLIHDIVMSLVSFSVS